MPFHPLIIHFPIVLLLLSAVMYAYIAFTNETRYNSLTEILHVAGILFMALAIFSGQQAEAQIAHTPEIHEMLEQHARLAWICVWVFGILFLWSKLRLGRWKSPEKYLFVLVFVIASGILGYSAHLGGRMVYEKGAGVLPMKEKLMEEVRKQ
ncbi:MAG: hypothetical protein K1X92_13555 [Bacteroidia bacterium]|nr:hypothetical protein [Bacteroidia bacterium]